MNEICINKIKIIFFYLLTILIFNYCDPAPTDDRLTIVNNSDKPIYFYYSGDNTIKELYLQKNGYSKHIQINYPGDNTIKKSHLDKNNTNENNTLYYCYSSQYIKAKSKRKVNEWNWGKYIKNCKSKTLYIFIFKEETIKKYSSEFIKRYNLFDKKYEYALKDLENNNWTIIYK